MHSTLIVRWAVFRSPRHASFAGVCGRPAWGSPSLSALQNPTHPSKSNSHINASLILGPEIDLCFSLQLCYHFTCPSWPLSNSPCAINIYGCAFPPCRVVTPRGTSGLMPLGVLHHTSNRPVCAQRPCAQTQVPKKVKMENSVLKDFLLYRK